MLQIETRPTWSPPFHADRVPEFSLSGLQHQHGAFLKPIKQDNSAGSSSMSDIGPHDCFPAISGGISANENEQVCRGKEISSFLRSSRSDEDEEDEQNDLQKMRESGSMPAGRRPITISRTKLAKTLQPSLGGATSDSSGRSANVSVEITGSLPKQTPLLGSPLLTKYEPPLKPTFNLPPIRLTCRDERASNSSSTSLLASISEPQSPSLRGSATHKTTADSKSDQSSPPLGIFGPSVSRASTPLLARQVVEIPARRIDTVLGATSADKVDTSVGRIPPIPSSSFSIELDSPTRRKRTLQEFQSDAENKLSSTTHQPSPQSVATDNSNVLKSPPSPLASLLKPEDVPITKIQPSIIPTNTQTIPHRTHKVDLLRKLDIDNSVESTLVLAHRAVTAIKNQSLPRPLTIGPTFTIGKTGSHPFGLGRNSHDGGMESEDESDTESIKTTSSGIMPPWTRGRMNRDPQHREDTPKLDEIEAFTNVDPMPIPGPQLLASSPRSGGENPGVYVLVAQLGDQRTSAVALADELHTERSGAPTDATENSEQRKHKADGPPSTESSQPKSNESSRNGVSATISPVNRPGRDDSGNGGGGDDPNKRPRMPSEHENDNDSAEYEARGKRRKREQDGNEDNEEIRFAEPDREGPVVFQKGYSPPSHLSDPSTVESITSTAPAYSETTATPLTMTPEVRPDFQSPIEKNPSNILPPIHHSNHFSPGRSPISPRTPHAPLPGVDSLLTAAEMKHPMGPQPPHPNAHVHGGGKTVKTRLTSHVNVAVSSSPNQMQPSTPRGYADTYSRAIPYVEPAQQYRAVTPRSQISPKASPSTEPGRNAPIAPAPQGFPGQSSASPHSQFAQSPSHYHTKIPARLEQQLPPLQTGYRSTSEPNSAKTPTKLAGIKGRIRNTTPKDGSDSGLSSPQAGGFKCVKEGCTAAPFSTQYLLNSHANVHSEDRPHFCPMPNCPRGEGGKGFKRKNEMIRHGLVHKSPGYVCPFCPEKEHRYPRPDNLQRHVKAHHKDRGSDDPQLREVLAVRPEGGQRGRRRRLGPPA